MLAKTSTPWRRTGLVCALIACLALPACQPNNEAGRQDEPTAGQSDEPATGADAGPQPFVGMYRYMADAAIFRDCGSGRSYPVLIEAGHLPLERAYLAQRGEPGAELLAVFEAEVVMRAPEPGLPEREHLRVTRFDELRPGESCPKSAD